MTMKNVHGRRGCAAFAAAVGLLSFSLALPPIFADCARAYAVDEFVSGEEDSSEGEGLFGDDVRSDLSEERAASAEAGGVDGNSDLSEGADEVGIGESKEPSESEEPSKSKYLPGWNAFDDGTLKYLNDQGEWQRGWLLLEGNWYFFDADGAMQTGWYSDGSHWYYLDPANGGRMAEGWLSLDGEWYHLASDGSMETGWLKEGSSWYHLASDGSMDTGWLSEGSYWYYLDPANGGRMATGVRVVDGVTYYFDLDGRSRPGLDRASLLSAVDSASGSKNTSVVNGTLSQSTIDRLDADLATIRTGGHEVGYLMIDLTTASVVSANASGYFYCASTIKGPYVCAAASGWPSKAVNWKSTMYDAISWSSNDAYRQLRSAFGSGVMSEFMNEADVSYFYPSTMWPDIRPRDLSKLWVRTYDYFRSTDANSDWVQDYFFHTKNSFIDAALGGSHHVYSKAGWIWESSRYYVYNDAAIVDDGWHPYVMVILSTANSSSSSALQTLATDLEAAHNELLSL